MLERLRHRPRLGTAVLGAFVLAWLVALCAGVPTRMALAQLQPADICAAAHAEHDAPAAEHVHHLDPGCVLCVALGTPQAVPSTDLRAPLPTGRVALPLQAVPPPALRAQAPLPARGPPPRFHA